MKIKINLGFIQIETETSKRQAIFYFGTLIFLLELINMLTLKINHDVLYWIIVVLASCGGIVIGKKT